MMSVTEPWRSRAGNAIILLMAVLSICTILSYYSLIGRDSGDAAGNLMNEDRFRPLRAVLPIRGTVGYISENMGAAESTKAYYLTQYYLAPVVVARETEHELVVANFASSSGLAELAAARGFTVEKDFANGVALLRRRR